MKTRRYQSLREYLDATGTTQVEFAARIGVTQAAVSRYVTGKARPSLSLAVRIAHEAQIPIESLLTEAA